MGDGVKRDCGGISDAKAAILVRWPPVLFSFLLAKPRPALLGAFRRGHGPPRGWPPKGRFSGYVNLNSCQIASVIFSICCLRSVCVISVSPIVGLCKASHVGFGVHEAALVSGIILHPMAVGYGCGAEQLGTQGPVEVSPEVGL